MLELLKIVFETELYFYVTELRNLLSKDHFNEPVFYFTSQLSTEVHSFR